MPCALALVGSVWYDGHMNVLLLGDDSVVHTFACKLVDSAQVDQLFVAPGNDGTRFLASSVAVDVTDTAATIDAVFSMHVDMVVADLPSIAAGVVDELQALAIPVFGCAQTLARLQTSRCFAREWLQHNGLPTSRSRVCHTQAQTEKFAATLSLPIAISPDDAQEIGMLCTERAAVPGAIATCLQASTGSGVLVEEYVAGPQITASLLSDGSCGWPVPAMRITPAGAAPYAQPMCVHRAASAVWQRLETHLDQRIRYPLSKALQSDTQRACGWIGATCVLGRSGPLVRALHVVPSGLEVAAALSCFDGDLVSPLLDCAHGRLVDVPSASWRDRAVVAIGVTRPPGCQLDLTGLEAEVRVFEHASAVSVTDGSLKRWLSRSLQPRSAALTLNSVPADGAAAPFQALVVGTAADLQTAHKRVYTALRHMAAQADITYRSDVGVREI